MLKCFHLHEIKTWNIESILIFWISILFIIEKKFLEAIEAFEKMLEERQAKRDAGELTDDEDEPDEKPPQNYTELDRLAFVVRAIETDCAALPVGAVKLTPNHEVRTNETFKGLSLQDAKKLENYQHFRNAQTEDKKQFIGKNLKVILKEE